MSFSIEGLGTALPDHALTQVQAALVAKIFSGLNDTESDSIDTLYRHTGISTRHVVFNRQFVSDVLDHNTENCDVFLPKRAVEDRGPSTGNRMRRYHEEALPLALMASRRALEEAQRRPDEISHLVTVSCTGFAAPGVDFGLITGLGLAPTVQRTHVGFMGCHGAINGLRVAQAYGHAVSGSQVLLCAVELCTLHLFYGWNPKKVVANALFADGAAAIVGSSEKIAGQRVWHVAATGSCLFPGSASAMTWTIGDYGFEMTLSTKVPALIAEHLRPWLESWLAENGLRIEEIPSWAIHPGGPRVLGAVQESLGLASAALAASHEVLAECGNMSSPTILFVVDRLRRREAPLPCVGLGFGPGLVAEAILFR
jgi:predicted naringenin-chalcone synthase